MALIDLDSFHKISKTVEMSRAAWEFVVWELRTTKACQQVQFAHRTPCSRKKTLRKLLESANKFGIGSISGKW